MQESKEVADNGNEGSQPTKRDINDSRVPAESRPAPWYKTVPTLISLVALLLSLGTTYFSYTRAEVQNIQNKKAELRALLQRLTSLPREYEEGMGKYRGDHNVEGAVNATIMQQNSLLSGHAAEIARQLPRASVSSAEWHTIAVGLQSDLRYDEAKELLGYALESAKGVNDKVAVLMATGDLLFKMGKPREGRDTYETALGVFSEFAGYDDRTKNETQIQIHLGWADSASYVGLSDEAAEHIAKAKSYWQKLPPGRPTEVIKAIMSGVERNVTTQTPRPNPPTLIASNSVGKPPRPPQVFKPKPHHPVDKKTRKHKGRRSCH